MKMGRVSPAVWLLAVALGLFGFALRFGILHVTGLGIHSFWFVAIAFVILALAPILRPH
jgi:hypothetical protein